MTSENSAITSSKRTVSAVVFLLLGTLLFLGCGLYFAQAFLRIHTVADREPSLACQDLESLIQQLLIFAGLCLLIFSAALISMSKRTVKEKTFPLEGSASLFRVRALSDRGVSRLQKVFSGLSLVFLLSGLLFGGAASCVRVPCKEWKFLGEGMESMERYLKNPERKKSITLDACSLL